MTSGKTSHGGPWYPKSSLQKLEPGMTIKIITNTGFKNEIRHPKPCREKMIIYVYVFAVVPRHLTIFKIIKVCICCFLLPLLIFVLL